MTAQEAIDHTLIARRIQLLFEIDDLRNAPDNAVRAERALDLGLGLLDALLMLHTTELDLEVARRLPDDRDIPEDEPTTLHGATDYDSVDLERALAREAIQAFRQGEDVIAAIRHRVAPISRN